MRACMLLGCIALLCLVNRAGAQQAAVIRGSDFGKHNQVFLDDSVWFFHPGELPVSKRPATTTAGWDTLRHTAKAPRQWGGWAGSACG